ncbi:MAG: tetratricopeptide repeat protein [Candidatus Latescibacterota bacterium]|nr:MAG: tetratricopeptide repeat protein [Candidatus Latescibacterota bacterium]
MNPRLRLWSAIALLALYMSLAVWSARSNSSVADEHPHILSGWLYWESGHFSGGLDNPPLAQLLVSAPFRLLRLDYAFPSDEHLGLARAPVLMLTLALALLLLVWSRRTGAALWVLVGLCLEPNLLAHGQLATLDAPLCFAWWLTLWFWRDYLLRETERAAAGARALALVTFTAAFTLAVYTKFTGLFLLPACWLVALWVLPNARARLNATAALLVALAAAALLSHAIYAFEPTRLGLPTHLVQALTGKLTHRSEGHFAYLAGRGSTDGFLAYYVATLLVKTPLPLLILALVGTVLSWRRVSRLDRALWILPALLVLAVFSWIRVNIGARHILPLYPALLLPAAYAMHLLWQRGRGARSVLAVLLLVWAVGVLRGAPQFLPYFNLAAGGPARGDRWLLDSNLDWGQDDRRLERFLQRRAARGEVWQVNPPGEVARIGRLAVNANTLHNLLRRDPTPYAWLRGLQPAAYAGWSWRLYAVDLEDLAGAAAKGGAAARAAYAEVLMQSGRREAALRQYEAVAVAAPPELFVSAIRALLELGDPTAAGGWVERALARHPSDPGVRLWAARAALESAVGVPEPDPRALFELGLWWASQGKAEQALPWLKQAAAARPDDAELVRELGIALLHAGRFDDAAALFGRPSVARELAAERSAALRLARTEAALGAPTRRAADRTALRDLATTHFADRRYDRAAAALVELLRQDPSDSQALALLSEMQVRAKLRIVPERLTPRRVHAR